ncbi:MAG: heparinase II/III family protein [Pseudomonadota bacterium]
MPVCLSHFMLSCLLAALLASPAGRAAEAPPEAVNPPQRVSAERFARIAAHPRLLADGARWEALRRQVVTDARSRALYAALRRQGEALLALGPVNYADPAPGENILATLRQYEHRVLALGILYRLGGEQRYLDATRALVLDLARREANRAHYLDAATYTLVLAIGLDWLYEHWSEAERAHLAGRIKQQTLEASVEQLGHHSFLWADFNWNQIGNNGLVFGALAIAEREPALARHIVNRSLALMPRIGVAYAPDGLYVEGPGYWNYGTLNHVYQIEALRTSLGDSFGLEQLPGFLASAAVLDHLTGPSGNFFNFSDNRPQRNVSAPVFWFARESGRADIDDAEWERLERALGGDLTTLRDLSLALLWRGSGAGRDVAAPLNWQTRGHQPVAVMRSRHADKMATWVALKGGTPNGSHGHMDAGSFVLEAGGVRWAEDPGYEDYLRARRRSGLTHAQLFDYGQHSARWRHFRLGPEGHNVLRFDGALPRVDGHAELLPLRTHARGGASARIALSSTYAGQAEQVGRTVSLLADGAVRIEDRWRAPANAAVATSWQWLTTAHARREGDGVVLRKDGRTLRLTVRQKGARIDIEDVDGLLDARFDAPLPGYRRIVVRIGTAAGAGGALGVLARLD